MFRNFVTHIYRRVSNVLFKDIIDKQVVINVPKTRGAFNPYEVFQVKNPWQQYIGVPRAELNTLQRVDRWLTLKHREWMRYQRFGLLLDDIVNDEDPVVIEALNRLPKAVKDARERRIIRAFELSTHHKELPKEEWTKAEDDVPYLRPYVLWVQYEMEELDAEKMQRDDIPLPPLSVIGPDDFDSGRALKRRYVD